MNDDNLVKLTKSQSPNITNDTKFKKIQGRLQRYTEDCEPCGFDSYPRIDAAAGDDLKKFQRGIIRITTQEKGEPPKHHFISMDAIQSVVLRTYSPTER